jgi:selenocysteine-specific elongation factor
MANRHVIGTAGHVDHGKTRLIEALTGIDADRLPEEKRRGMTIDLGFAHFSAPTGEMVGVVDVPGHERFIRNMVAGAWGLDLALLVVAADDGWMQQSEDHTRVLAALGVPRLILVVSKCDLAGAEAAEAVRRQALSRLEAHGYGASPSLLVSAHQDLNIHELKSLILHTLSGLAAPDATERDAPYLYVDRVFKITGAGTVVTGTLRGGSLNAEQELRLCPGDAKLRIRGLQSYHREERRVQAVCRLALNLTGAADIRRGDLLSTKEAGFQAAGELIARLDPAPATQPGASPGAAASQPSRLKNQMEVELALGTTHTRARLHLLPEFEEARLARLLLHQPLAARWQQPFLLIRQGGSAILASGKILYLGSTTRAERQRLLPVLRKLPPGAGRADRLALAVELKGRARWDRFLPAPPTPGPGQTLLGAWLFDSPRLRSLEAEIATLAGRSGGITFAELAGKMRIEEEALRLVTRRLCDSGVLRLSRNVLLPAGSARAAGLSPLGGKLLEDLRLEGKTGLEVKKLGIAGGQKELRNLARMELAVSLDGNIYLAAEAYQELLQVILRGLQPGERFDLRQAKERSGLSRKYILPLLNRMELDGYVRREGDLRELLKIPPS